MKTKLLLTALVGLFFTTFALAQDAAVAAPISPDAQNFILGLMQSLVLKYPVLATVITVLGSMRLWAKPVFSLLHTVTDLTPTKFDDGIWATTHAFFSENALGKSFVWLLDFVASVKLVPPAAKPPSN